MGEQQSLLGNAFGYNQYDTQAPIAEVAKNTRKTLDILTQIQCNTNPANATTNTSSTSSSNTLESTQVANGVKLDAILAELRDDRLLTETVWYDKTDVTKFYIRKTTVNQDNGTIVISFLNIDGTTATPVITDLVSVVSTKDIEVITTEYDVITNGTGYSIGDQVEELKLINTLDNTVTLIYYNKTLNTTITPSFVHLILAGKYCTPSHIELLTGSTTLTANTYKSISLVIISGTANITIDGTTISNYPSGYTETWGNGQALISKSIILAANASTRIIINLLK